jgi:hypothetical protein
MKLFHGCASDPLALLGSVVVATKTKCGVASVQH